MEFITQLDTQLLWGIQNAFKCGFLDAVMPLITALGNGGILWIAISAVLAANRKTRRIAIAMATAMMICLIVGNGMIKPIVGRIRPFAVDGSIVLLIAPPSEFSFPSGHTMNAFAAATSILLFNKRWGSWAILLATIIAFSRLYLMVHYPTDVIVGALIGVAAAFLARAICERLCPPKWLGQK